MKCHLHVFEASTLIKWPFWQELFLMWHHVLYFLPSEPQTGKPFWLTAQAQLTHLGCVVMSRTHCFPLGHFTLSQVLVAIRKQNGSWWYPMSILCTQDVLSETWKSLSSRLLSKRRYQFLEFQCYGFCRRCLCILCLLTGTKDTKTRKIWMKFGFPFNGEIGSECLNWVLKSGYILFSVASP